jgi:hypothetical protein
VNKKKKNKKRGWSVTNQKDGAMSDFFALFQPMIK